MTDRCPDDDLLAQMLDGTLPADALAQLHEHVDQCGACSKLLVELGHLVGPGDHRAPPTTRSLAAERQLGRYEVLDIVGRGGMGTVYVAFDPELDRRVALKVLHVGTDRAHERLRREARAMARLSHPNVAQVHEVGSFEGGQFVAMELVEGGTLETWSRGRPWRQVLRACIEAGRGLQAAHEAGLVHRDFKPANVLCDAQGRARVTDFGLVLSVADEFGHTESTPPNIAPVTAAPVTQSGSVLGTRGFMAPEQARGEPADERSDQFSFCVTVWQVLSGEHPLGGPNPTTATPKWPADGPKVRRELVVALTKGLQQQADQRWPSMAATLAALERASRPRRWPWLIVPVVGLAVWGAVQGHERYQLERSRERCEQIASEVDALWDTEHRADVRRAFSQSEVSFAAALSDKVPRWLDQRAAQLREQTTEACHKREIQRVWDAPTYAKAAWCLREQRIEFQVLLEEFSSADAAVATGAVQAAAAPPRIGSCLDETVLGARPAPPEIRSEALNTAHRQLVRARVLHAEGQFERGLAAARAARASAEADALPQLALSARATEALLLYSTGEFDRAALLAESTYLTAMRGPNWDVAATSARARLYVAAIREQPEQATLWAELATVSLTHAGDPTGIREARLMGVLAMARRLAGDLHGAQQLAQRSLATIDSVLGPKHPWVADGLVELGWVAIRSGDAARAAPVFERALSISEALLSDEHPAVASALSTLGIARLRQGRTEEAAELLHRARGILEKHDRRRLPATLGALAILAWDSGDMEESKRLYERTLQIDLEFDGPEANSVATDLANLGGWYGRQNRIEEARDHLERALEILIKHPKTAGITLPNTLNNLGALALNAGDYSAASTNFAQALSAFERFRGSEHPDLAFALTGLGQALMQLDRVPEAIPHLERAIRLRPDSAVDRAPTQYALAQALWSISPEHSPERSRALDLAQDAAETFEQGGAGSARELAGVQAWLSDKQ